MAIDRLSLQDAINVAADRCAAPTNIGALLVLSHEPSSVRGIVLAEEMAKRLAPVPRLRQVLLPAPFAGGRPYWADDPRFDSARHAAVLRVEDGDAALLDAAADLTTLRLPRNRPLWRVRVLIQPTGRRAIVVVLHHLVTDGLGGLAALAALDDGDWQGGHGRAHTEPAAVASHRDLRADAWRSRRAEVRRLPAIARSAMAGIREMGLDRRRPSLVDRSSFNRPTGPRRRVAVADVALEPMLAAARVRRATLNDLVVAVVVGAVADAMRCRGEDPSRLVVSVPISGRPVKTDAGMGNEVGVMPVEVPARVGLDQRVAAVADETRARRAGARGSSGDVIAMVSRALAATGTFRFFIEHQRLVTTIESNLRGPAATLRLGGHEVERLVPIGVSPGNLGVSFLACSYAGRLGVSVVADPDVVPEYAAIAAHIDADLAELARTAR